MAGEVNFERVAKERRHKPYANLAEMQCRGLTHAETAMPMRKRGLNYWMQVEMACRAHQFFDNTQADNLWDKKNAGLRLIISTALRVVFNLWQDSTGMLFGNGVACPHQV